MQPREAKVDLEQALACAVDAARATGQLLRDNLHSAKRVHAASQHDIKLELDVRCQRRIERTLRGVFPHVAVLGEEGITGNPDASYRWVVDPIDGTVNYTYGIPHACVAIALQGAGGQSRTAVAAPENLVGVVYDPFCDELWTAVRGRPARLNGRIIHVSRRRRLAESVITVGFAKHRASLERMLPVFSGLIHRVRKLRIMGSAALALTYVASGRFDAYLETGVRLWDIAAGGLILECAGGCFDHAAVAGADTYRVLASNGLMHRALRRIQEGAAPPEP